MHNLNSLKSGPKMIAIAIILKIIAQSKQSPNGRRKFAQSGHPGRGILRNGIFWREKFVETRMVRLFIFKQKNPNFGNFLRALE
jgi:hypothetical protein